MLEILIKQKDPQYSLFFEARRQARNVARRQLKIKRSSNDMNTYLEARVRYL